MNFIHAVTALPAWWMTALGSPRRSQSDRLRKQAAARIQVPHHARGLHFWRRVPSFLEARSAIARTLPRRPISALTSVLAETPAVALLGPRQFGKTIFALELANTRPAVYLHLESSGN